MAEFVPIKTILKINSYPSETNGVPEIIYSGEGTYDSNSPQIKISANSLDVSKYTFKRWIIFGPEEIIPFEIPQTNTATISEQEFLVDNLRNLYFDLIGIFDSQQRNLDVEIRLYAEFDVITKLTIIANENEGTVSGEGNYPQGSIVTVTASPRGGFSFLNWTRVSDNFPVSSAPTYSFYLYGDTSINANFARSNVLDPNYQTGKIIPDMDYIWFDAAKIIRDTSLPTTYVTDYNIVTQSLANVIQNTTAIAEKIKTIIPKLIESNVVNYDINNLYTDGGTFWLDGIEYSGSYHYNHIEKKYYTNSSSLEENKKELEYRYENTVNDFSSNFDYNSIITEQTENLIQSSQYLQQTVNNILLTSNKKLSYSVSLIKLLNTYASNYEQVVKDNTEYYVAWKSSRLDSLLKQQNIFSKYKIFLDSVYELYFKWVYINGVKKRSEPLVTLDLFDRTDGFGILESSQASYSFRTMVALTNVNSATPGFSNYDIQRAFAILNSIILPYLEIQTPQTSVQYDAYCLTAVERDMLPNCVEVINGLSKLHFLINKFMIYKVPQTHRYLYATSLETLSIANNRQLSETDRNNLAYGLLQTPQTLFIGYFDGTGDTRYLKSYFDSMEIKKSDSNELRNSDFYGQKELNDALPIETNEKKSYLENMNKQLIEIISSLNVFKLLFELNEKYLFPTSTLQYYVPDDVTRQTQLYLNAIGGERFPVTLRDSILRLKY